jgi:hypothetical protein
MRSDQGVDAFGGPLRTFGEGSLDILADGRTIGDDPDSVGIRALKGIRHAIYCTHWVRTASVPQPYQLVMELDVDGPPYPRRESLGLVEDRCTRGSCGR